MHLDPVLLPLVGIITLILSLGLLLQKFSQPQLVGYILAGVIIGPSGLSIITDQVSIERLANIGVTLLLYFVGMEVSPKQLIKGWKIAVLGTLFQVLFSVGSVWTIGNWLDWELPRILLLGFVISLSSTAVVLKLLKDRDEISSKAGSNVLLILLAQDLAIVPMLISISLMVGEQPTNTEIAGQVLGGIGIFVLAIFLAGKDKIQLPFSKLIRKDHEIQVFAALLICFLLAFITAYLGLSSALGAFVAGMVVATAKETDWVHKALEPLKIIFVAILFVSVGLLVDVQFIVDNFAEVMLLVSGVLLSNTFINAIIFRFLGDDWQTSLYSGALLSQVGEFSFVLASVGLSSAIITGYAHQMTIAVISISLILSPLWIVLFHRLTQIHSTK